MKQVATVYDTGANKLLNDLNDLKEVESSEAFKRQLRKAKPTLDKIQFEKEAIMIDNKDLDFIYF